ncbi:MAG TPA: kynureninase [Phycisphaerales bacterium]|nr:kynureninase [Phycisphaerales bacterium]
MPPDPTPRSSTIDTSEAHASALDRADPLASSRERFHVPLCRDVAPGSAHPDQESVYLCGNSLGLMPRATREAVNAEMDDWARLGVEGHLHARHPWLPTHEFVRETAARLVGARPHEVVVMNSLTVNLHLMMATFYRPSGKRTKIVIEDSAFPSDSYAVASQAAFHGLDPRDAVIRLRPRSADLGVPKLLKELRRLHQLGEASTSPAKHVRQQLRDLGHYGGLRDVDLSKVDTSSRLLATDRIEEFLAEEGDSVALMLIGGVNYLSGQVMEMERLTEAGHRAGALVGWDLAHAAGNVPLNLHDWNADFACWCSYKYLNSGPGAVAGCFVHEKHSKNTKKFGEAGALKRFAGWWGNDPKTRFVMGPEFEPVASADAWSLSNPPVLAIAPVRVSLEIFDKAGMPALRAKSERMTGYLQALIDAIPGAERLVEVITPRQPGARGCQLSIAVKERPKDLHKALGADGVVCDFREPNVIRVAPVPLYNTFHDCWWFAEILKRHITGGGGAARA